MKSIPFEVKGGDKDGLIGFFDYLEENLAEGTIAELAQKKLDIQIEIDGSLFRFPIIHLSESKMILDGANVKKS